MKKTIQRQLLLAVLTERFFLLRPFDDFIIAWSVRRGGCSKPNSCWSTRLPKFSSWQASLAGTARLSQIFLQNKDLRTYRGLIQSDSRTGFSSLGSILGKTSHCLMSSGTSSASSQ